MIVLIVFLVYVSRETYIIIYKENKQNIYISRGDPLILPACAIVSGRTEDNFCLASADKLFTLE